MVVLYDLMRGYFGRNWKTFDYGLFGALRQAKGLQLNNQVDPSSSSSATEM